MKVLVRLVAVLLALYGGYYFFMGFLDSYLWCLWGGACMLVGSAIYFWSVKRGKK